MNRRYHAGLALLGLVALGACHKKDRTEVVVGLATDLTAPAPLKKVSIQAYLLPDEIQIGDAGTTFPISGAVSTVYELPGTYGIYSEAGTADRVRVVLTAIDDQGATLVVRSAVFNLVPEKTLFVRLGVISACVHMTDCPMTTTCIEGRCAPEDIDSSRLPSYQPGIEKTVECAGVVTFVDTSTMQPLMQTGTTCPSGTCAEGVCLSPGAGGAGGSEALGGGAGEGGAGGATGGAAGGGMDGAGMGVGGVGGGGAGGQMVVSRPANLKATYRLNQSFVADQGGMPALVPVDPQASSVFQQATVLGATRTVWAFNGASDPVDQEAGLTLATPGVVNAESYSVDMVMAFTDPTRAGGWRRLLDVQDRQSDNGFYVDPSNNLDIYPVSGSTAAFDTSVFHHLAMTVDGTAEMPILRAYLDGVLQFSSMTSEMDLDADPDDNPGQLLGFFLDNVAGGGLGEWSSGQVAIIRMWDGVLTDAQVATLAGNPFLTGTTAALTATSR